ncbi:MAG: hypothetical protein RIQ81_1680 [Pseudomonadota bacterium]|jgi:glycosyltransferase involved in cell wall biosynthesis
METAIPLDQNFWLTVIIPLFNGAEYIASTLESIESQNFADLTGVEVIVVDDGSDDAGPQIVSEFVSTFRCRLLSIPHTGNWASNSNIGLNEAAGVFSCFLHQDDRWESNRLKLIKEAINNKPDCEWITTESWFINANGERTGRWRSPFSTPKSSPVEHQPFHHLLVQNSLSICAPVFRTEIAVSNGGLNARTKYTADWEFWLKLAARASWIHLKEPTVSFRVHRNSQTMQIIKQRDEFRRNICESLDFGIALARKENICVPEPLRQMAQFSADVNIFLAEAGQSGITPMVISLTNLLKRALKLGGRGLLNYMHASRIVDRILARRAIYL